MVEVGASRLLVDCGLSAREAELRLARLGLAPPDLAGIVVTHEHDDHVSGVFGFARKHGLPVWITYGTWRALNPDPDAAVESATMLIDSHTPFAIGEIEVTPLPVPHDAREPVQYLFSDGARRLGLLTDTGASTRHIETMLSGCEALVLECNHDPELLARGPYPRWLKERVGGSYGHLANSQAAALVAAIDQSRLTHVVAAHLSETNNTPALARAALAGALNCSLEWIGVAEQGFGFDWRTA